MKEYVFHTDFNGPIISSKDSKEYPRGTKVFLQPNNFIVDENGETICTKNSSVAKNFLVSNFDGKWEERAELVKKISLDNRKKKSDTTNGVYRFSDDEVKTLGEKYKDYLENDSFAIIFNSKLLEADIEILQQMIKDLNLTI